MPRINVRAGSMGRAVGALDLIDTLRAALPDVEIVETGSDGAGWAAPVIAAAARPSTGSGRAAAAPATPDEAVRVARFLLDGDGADDAVLRSYLSAQTRRLLARAGDIDPTSLEEAREAGAYLGWERARGAAAEEVVATVEASGLRGRGGAYFPLHLKWRSAREAAQRNGRPLLVINAEEGEPGVFKDRVLMESDPHALIEGIRIAAHAIGAERAYCYINGQAELSAERVRGAIDAAETAGIVGPDAGLVIEIRLGAGGYVCGEETVILESIEGQRAVPRLRPPFPTESGLWGRPTVINNVETLCNLPAIFRDGPERFREVGTEEAPGTKLICLTGSLPRPGLIEVPMGTSIAEILRIGGAEDAAEPVEGVVAGGPSGGLLPPSKFDRPIGPGFIDEAGAVLGSGGMVAFGAAFPVADVLALEADYNAQESCGKCTPCREGSGRLADALRRLRDGNAAGKRAALRDIEELVPVLRLASLCGLGQMAPHPATSALQDFAEEIGATARRGP